MELNRELPDAFFSRKLLLASLALAAVLFPLLERALDRWMPGAHTPPAPASAWDLRSRWS
jgi:hypothetical protein